MKIILCVMAFISLCAGTVAADDKQGGQRRTILRQTFGSQIRSLDPATCGDTTSARFLAHFYEGLYDYHYLKRPVTLTPLLAAAMPKVSDDGLTYTIKIKKGLKYSRNPCFGWNENGKLPVRIVKAADFVLAIKRCADWHIGSGLGWAFLKGRIEGLDEWRKKTVPYAPRDLDRYDLPVAGLKAIDDLTLQIRLTGKYPQLVHVLALLNFAPVPREAMDFYFTGRWAKAIDRKLPPVFETSFGELQLPGTGPYVLKVYAIGSPIIMVRNVDFRNQRYPTAGGADDKKAGLLDDAGKKAPFVDEIHWWYVASSKDAWEMFITGKVATTGISKDMVRKILTDKMKLRPEWKTKGIELVRYDSPSIFWLVFNMKDPVFSAGKSLRQAMCLAFDVEEYTKVLFDNRGVQATTFIPRSFAEHDLAPSPHAKFDLTAAKKKIEQAKKELAAKGLLENGRIPTIRLDMAVGDIETIRRAEFIKKQFARIGLTIKPVFNSWPELQKKIHEKQVQFHAMGWHADYPDAENFLQLYYSPNINRGTNNSNYSNPEYDRLYVRISTMQPSKERTRLIVEMLKILNEDCPVLLLTEPVNFTLRWKWLKNYKPHPFGYGYSRYLRIDAALQKKLTKSLRVSQ